DVGPERVAPLVVRDVLQRLVGHLVCGVAHQHVDAPELVHGPRDDVPAVLRLGQVATDEHGAAPGLLDELGDLGRVVVLAQVGNEDVGAFPRVRDGDRPADPAVRAGDHRHLAGELAGAPVAGLPGVGHRIHLGLDAGRFLLLLRLTHAGGLPGPAAASPPEPGYRASGPAPRLSFPAPGGAGRAVPPGGRGDRRRAD